MTKETRPSKEDVQRDLADGTLIEKYQKMVFRIAHNMMKVHPAESFDELVAEGYWGILQWVPRYEPEKCSIDTWVYKSAWDVMKDFCRDPRRHRHIFVDPTTSEYTGIAKENWFTSFLWELSEDASILATTVVESPTELEHVIRETARITSRRALKEYMLKKYGWSRTRINNALREISECL